MRLFIGVWLSEKMRSELEGFLVRMSRDFPQFKWTSPKNLHFTLKFLGEVGPEKIFELNKGLSQCTAGFQGFELDLGPIGYFPNNTNPNIVWIGVNRGRMELAHLAKKIEYACAELGFPMENRPFQPHLTIARARSGDRVNGENRFRAGLDRCPKSDLVFQSLTKVGSFSLIESQLTPGGSVYTPLAEFSFGGTDASGVV